MGITELERKMDLFDGVCGQRLVGYKEVKHVDAALLGDQMMNLRIGQLHGDRWVTSPMLGKQQRVCALGAAIAPDGRPRRNYRCEHRSKGYPLGGIQRLDDLCQLGEQREIGGGKSGKQQTNLVQLRAKRYPD